MAEMVRVEEAYIERDETINAQGAVMEIEILRCMSFSCLPVEMIGL